MRPPARLRRTYFDCRFGQLHVYQAIPPGGGFDEATALLCIPGAIGEGRFFQALLDLLDSLRQRRVDVLAHGAGAEVAAALAAARPNGLVRRVVCSAPSPGALALVRKHCSKCDELTLADTADASISDATARSQVNDLIRIFGAAQPG